MKDSPELAGKMKIEVQLLRCSACNKRFSAFPGTGKAACRHCGEKYEMASDGQWWDVTVRDALHRNRRV